MKELSVFLTSAATRARVSHGGRGSRPAKNMLNSASSRRISASRMIISRSKSDFGFWKSAKQMEPEQRQPQLFRIGHGPIVDQHFTVRHRPDQLEEIAERVRVAREKPRPIAAMVALAGLEEFLRRPGLLDRPREVLALERRKDERDRERQ